MAGSRGVISVVRWGQLGSPLPAPRVFGCCHVFGRAAGGGMAVGSSPPSPFRAGGGKGTGITSVPAGRTPGACPLPAEAQRPRAPSPGAVPLCIY